MALVIQSSNRVEQLQQNLSETLACCPLSDPMATEMIVVPTYAMARWLNLRIAQQQGIATNIDYLLPAHWLWRIARRMIEGLPDQDPLRSDTMVWSIFAVLPEFVSQSGFENIRGYLCNDPTGIKCWQLSGRIAAVFERYQQYRPRVIEDWSNGGGDDWQAVIWRTLINNYTGHHRVDIFTRLIEQLHGTDMSVSLPERISVFTLSSLPPLTIEVLNALAQQTLITLYQHSPTDQYFADLKSSQSLARLQRRNAPMSACYETGNELLAAWGRQGQAMQTLLLEQATVPSSDIDCHHPPGNARLLTCIQQSIFDLNGLPANVPIDDSVSIHLCHSPMRECQVLQDQLCHMLSEYPGLSTEDILVMVPEISRYAPYIEAVFGTDGDAGRPRLPWNLSDVNVIDEQPLVQSLLQLLALPGSRFEYAEVMLLLEVAEIRARFDIDDIALTDIREWADAAQIRWGIDATFKAALDLPETAENTWQQALDRLFAGYALDGIDHWHGIVPLPQIDSERAANIGKFCQFFERLQYWYGQLGQSASGDEWITRLNRLMDDFYATTHALDDGIQPIRNSIDTLRLAGDCQLSAPLLRVWLEKQLTTQQRQGRLFSGGVTFCGMQPMRNLPFQVICLLGMNDQAFPRRQPYYDFDLMRRQPQIGDPGSADADRYLMLETLLSARHTLYISYVGRSLKDNIVCQPSVLVQELLDFIDAQFIDASNMEKPSAGLVQVHPMQVFSKHNYIEPLFSFDADWCQVARQLNQAPAVTGQQDWPQPLARSEIITRPPIRIDLQQLHHFIRHPIAYCFKTQFKITINRQAVHENCNNDEYFTLDALSTWNLRNRLADYRLQGRSVSVAILSAEGLLPHGIAAQFELDRIQTRYADWFERLVPFHTAQQQSQSVHLALYDDVLLMGEVENYYNDFGLMHHSASRLKGWHLLRLWLDHLCLCAGNQLAETDSSQLMTLDQVVAFKWLEATEATRYLQVYIDLFRQGQQQLLPIFPASSFAFAQAEKPDMGLKQAYKAWESGFGSVAGDQSDPYIQLALRRSVADPIAQPGFAEYAGRLYQAPLANRLA